MCITSADIRAEEEMAFLDILCEKCLDKVDCKLQSTGKTLFDFGSDDYGFCPQCNKAVYKLATEL
jgi:hypothetical protein